MVLEGFLAIFPSPEKDLVLKRLDGEERRIHFAQFIEGGGSEGTLGYRVLNRLTELVQTRQGLRDRCQELKKRIDQLVTQPVDEESTLLLAACRNERQALLTLVGSINRRQTLNFFTDEGLLPNYAFPEEGVTLNSVILRRRELREDGETGSPFEKFQFSFQRSAQAALGELVPDANFYAAEHRLNIEQVDLKLSKPQAWRLCPNCQHCENTDETGDPNGACPRCGSAQWSDIGQKRTLLKLRQVFARADARRDRIGDDSDERVPAFYRRQLLVDVHPESHAGAFRMDREDLPFGFEYLRNASFREINFGEVGTMGIHSRWRDGTKLASGSNSVASAEWCVARMFAGDSIPMLWTVSSPALAFWPRKRTGSAVCTCIANCNRRPSGSSCHWPMWLSLKPPNSHSWLRC